MIVVTGGAGLIGSACVEELNYRGEENILIVDHLGSSEKWKNLKRVQFLDYWEKDLFYQKLVQNQLPKNITLILHLGACSSTTETNASYLIQNNYEYTKVLCEYALENKIQFVYASSAATYGDGKEGYSDEVDLQKLKPLNMYGYSKHLFDLYAYKKGYLHNITGIKYFNVFGYGEDHKGDMRSLVLKGYWQIKTTGVLKLFKSHRPDYKDGEQKRDFLYVKDAAKITLHLAFQRHYGIYNAGRGIAQTWNELAHALFQAMNIQPNIKYIEMPEELKEKYQYYTCADTKKLMKTNYKGGFTNLEDACREYVKLLNSVE